MDRKILHLDLDAFFCEVERQLDPTLDGKPFAVGGRPEERGVVASCSYPARQFGVRSAMPMSQAVRICPDLIVVQHHFDAYRSRSRQVMARLRDITELVEQLSIDEAFLDVSERAESAEEIAYELQKSINEAMDLPCSLGVATNKLVAKIANNIGKASVQTGRPPNTVNVIPPGTEAAFLAPLGTRELWGVGPKTAEKLAELGIDTIGDLAQWDELDLGQRFGKNGYDLARRAQGIDERPIVTDRPTKSVSRETTFVNDVRDLGKLKGVLRELSDDVGEQLRKLALRGSTMKLKLRRTDFTILTRQTTLTYATDDDQTIFRTVEQLLEIAQADSEAVRLIGVGVSGFREETAPQQLTIWDVL
jgi:DNA polymerase-4